MYHIYENKLALARVVLATTNIANPYIHKFNNINVVFYTVYSIYYIWGSYYEQIK